MPRPAVLVGYGDFGLEVLQRLLASAAMHRDLDWQAPEGAASPSERNLRDLALVVVGGRRDPMEGTGEDTLELMRDLYQQIRQVPAGPGAGDRLAEEVTEQANRLLDVRSRAGRDATAPVGLDVFLLAHPSSSEDAGLLGTLMEPAVRKLADRAHLEASGRLNLIQVLDFEEYWNRSDAGRRELRRTVCDNLTHWQRRNEDHQPAFRRIYLVDSDTNEGPADPRQRIDEIVLFLEVLLFEGQRSGMQDLYGESTDRLPPAATFSVRLLEQPTELLRRLAAARFGERWLAFLGGDDRGDDDEALRVAQVLGPFHDQEFTEMFTHGELSHLLERSADELTSELLELSPAVSDWPDRIADAYERGAGHIRERLATAAGHRMEELRRRRLGDFSAELRRAVIEDLHDDERPVSVNAVLRSTEVTLHHLEGQATAVSVRSTGSPAGEAEGREPYFTHLTAVHRRYERFRDERVEPRRLRTWWPLFAALIAAGALPLTVDLLHDVYALVPEPDPVSSSRLAGLAYQALGGLLQPTIHGALLLAAGLAAVGFGLHRSLARRIDHDLRVYDHPERGRLTDAVRAGMAPGGPLRAPLESFLADLQSDLRSAILSELRRELRDVSELLQRRLQEIAWLRDDLRRFLRVYRAEEGAERIPAAGSVRLSLEEPEDLERVVQENPPGEGRFRSLPASFRPFEHWQEVYCDTFLYPLAFIERLGRDYRDPLLDALQGERMEHEERRWRTGLDRFIEQQGSPGLRLRVPQREGVPVASQYALLPDRWQTPRAAQRLVQALQIDQEHIRDCPSPGRAYLLRLQTGLPPEVLSGE